MSGWNATLAHQKASSKTCGTRQRLGAVAQSSYAILDPERGLLHTGFLDRPTLEEWIVFITG
ncbi:hypothetical protein [Glycomyces salinus]|uniref:hypothetical protein n=1 Tax=Glycomyces salinus TaxID=980294 RepID=UPI0018EB2BFE|nr:hypothetical protein [Glycomyces salinus]